jgi:hypothetical protein
VVSVVSCAACFAGLALTTLVATVISQARVRVQLARSRGKGTPQRRGTAAHSSPGGREMGTSYRPVARARNSLGGMAHLGAPLRHGTPGRYSHDKE